MTDQELIDSVCGMMKDTSIILTSRSFSGGRRISLVWFPGDTNGSTFCVNRDTGSAQYFSTLEAAVAFYQRF